MAEQSFEEKTEKPTPKKRLDVRKKGEVAKSRELPSIAVLLSGLLVLAVSVSYMNSQIHVIMERAFKIVPSKDVSLLEIISLLQEMTGLFIIIVGPVMAAVFITAILSNIMQFGFLLSPESIRPKLSKLDPLKGFGRLFSAQSLMELSKSMLKLLIVGFISYLSVRSEMDNIPALIDMELKAIMSYILITIFKISIRCTLAMVLLAAADYAFQRWQFEKRIKMSQKEIKDEFKTTEGDPHVKSRIKSLQMEMSRKRMMQDVPKADVVITNPTHLAVALKYDGFAMNAPKLLAKGAGEIAAKIKEIANKHEIPVVENKPLARNLYASVDIGEEIPADLYEAVAEVLAYIYGLKNKN
jgi:flagellar biosynthetic protein FlhB